MNKVKKFKKGDQVLVVKGKDAGKKGTILRVLPAKHQLVIEGVNLLKKHIKSTKKNPQGGIIDINHPVPTSNVRIVCPDTGKPSRVSFKLTRSGDKERIAKSTGSSLDIKK